MPLPEHHKRRLRIQHGLVPALFNLVLNAGIAWLLFRSHAEVSLFGEAGVAVDLLATGFILPFAICLIDSLRVRSQVRSGKLQVLESPRPVRGGWDRRPPLVRALGLGAAGVVLASAPLVLAVSLAEPVPLWTFIASKGIWAGLLAAIVSPLVFWWALSSASNEWKESAA